MNNIKEKYRNHCEKEASIPLFSQAWWLDAVAGPDGWSVAIVEKNDQIVASLPYVLEKTLCFTVIAQPKLTQSLGPWFSPSEAKYAKTLRREKDLMEELLAQLPAFHHYTQNWNTKITNWLPVFWKGFSQTTRYTYVLNNLEDENVLWKNLEENIRREIRKAKDRYEIKIRTDLDVNDFLELNKLVFKRQGKALPYSEDLVRTLDKACSEHSSRKIFIAEDKQGNRHAAVYLVWDQHSAYYLMGGGDPELRNSGATSLCMWEAILFASSVTKKFDFEGSMIESIERFFCAFGSTQTPYFNISKTSSKILRILYFIKSFKR